MIAEFLLVKEVSFELELIRSFFFLITFYFILFFYILVFGGWVGGNWLITFCLYVVWVEFDLWKLGLKNCTFGNFSFEIWVLMILS